MRKWMMARLVVMLLLLFAAAGCSARFDSSLLEWEGRLAVPVLGGGGQLPVLYPAPAGRESGEREPMVAAYGPGWRDLESRYPDYVFNP